MNNISNFYKLAAKITKYAGYMWLFLRAELVKLSFFMGELIRKFGALKPRKRLFLGVIIIMSAALLLLIVRFS